MRVNLRKRHMGGQFTAIKGSFRVIIVIWFLMERQKNAVILKSSVFFRKFLNKHWCVGVGMKYFLNSFFDIMKYVIIMVFI